LFYNFKTNHYEKSIQEAKNRTDFSNLGAILSVATGAAIAKYSGKPKTAGIISAGLSLLVTGLITAMDDDATETYFNNN
jgi:p-aminobenzoyl-glutamate transporter AbgT